MLGAPEVQGSRRYMAGWSRSDNRPRYLPWSDVVRRRFASDTGIYRCGRKNQPGIGHQAVIVESDVDAVGVVAW